MPSEGSGPKSGVDRTRSRATPPANLADFTATRRMIPISALAVLIGVLSAYVALALLKLISLFTNLFFFHKADFASRSPAEHTLGIAGGLLVPVVGGLIIGVMARY